MIPSIGRRSVNKIFYIKDIKINVIEYITINITKTNSYVIKIIADKVTAVITKKFIKRMLKRFVSLIKKEMNVAVKKEDRIYIKIYKKKRYLDIVGSIKSFNLMSCKQTINCINKNFSKLNKSTIFLDVWGKDKHVVIPRSGVIDCYYMTKDGELKEKNIFSYPFN